MREQRAYRYLRVRDGGVRHGADLLQPDRPGEDRAARAAPARHVVFGAGVLFFPISYVFGDILTEVYGYARARRVIWAGFAGLAFASFMAAVVVALPPAPFWKNQAAYEIAFGSDLAHRGGVDDRLFLRRVRQFLRAGEDEDPDGREMAVDPHHRLHHRRRGGGLRSVLSPRLLRQRHHPRRQVAAGHARPVRRQGRAWRWCSRPSPTRWSAG